MEPRAALRLYLFSSAWLAGTLLPVLLLWGSLSTGNALLLGLPFVGSSLSAALLRAASRESGWRRPANWLGWPALLDAFAVLPCLAAAGVPPRWLLLAPHLLCVRHVVQIRPFLEEFDDLKPITYRLVPLALVMPLLVHLSACSWIALGSGSAGPDADPWVEYARTVYWAMTTLTTVGYGDIFPRTIPQMALAAVVQLTGVGVFGFIVSNVASFLSRLDAAREHHLDNLESIEDFMRSNHIPEAMRGRVRAYFHYLWKTHKGHAHRSLVDELPRKFQSELLFHINRSMVEKVPFLQEASRELMEDLMHELKRKIFVPGERIFRAGEQGDAMYFIHSGEVRILAADGGAIATLRDGAVFGETALVKDQPRNASAEAARYCDVYMLQRDSFLLVIAAYPEFRQHLEEMASLRAA